MPSPVRLVAAAALALASLGAAAQTVVPPAVIVQQLAPQTVNFTGSQLNFQSLVNGLALGAPVQLVTVLPNGFTQVVTFTPLAALAPADIARVLETARQQLIGLGIAAPTAEQIGFTLMGGIVPTALGGSPVSGVLNPQNPPSPAAQMQRNAATGGSTSASPPPATSLTPAPAVTSSVTVQFIPSATTGPTTTPAGNTSNTPTPAAGTDVTGASTVRAAPPGTPPAGRPTRN